MPSLHLPLIVRSVILRALCALIWKSGLICRISPRRFRWRWLGSSSSIWTVTSPWDRMGFILGCWGSWRGWLLSRSLPSISAPGYLERSQRTGGLSMWLPSTGSQPVYKKGMRENKGKLGPVSLASVLGKVMEVIILGDIKSQLKNKAIIRHSQNKSIKRKSCISNLISFYHKVTNLVGKQCM